jgi:two-component system response regulator (stage 0 sporulation protein F)
VTGERRALVVDDDPGIRVLVTRILTRNGFLVESARDGAEAIEKVLQHDYKVITLDLMMPRIDGFAVVKYLSEHRPEMLANVIVVTAFGPNAREKVCPPVVRVVEKPFELNALVAAAAACADDATGSD